MAIPTGRPSGRPPKPIEVKRATGNPGKRPLPAAPLPGEGIQAATAVPKPPRELDKKGKELWNTLWVNGRNHLSLHDDLAILLLLCHAWDELEYCRVEKKRLKETGMLYQLTPNGFTAAHPILKTEKELYVQTTAWLSELGFSPTARSRLGLSEIRDSDPMDEMARRRANNADRNGQVNNG